jgi:hypothetical protein
MWLSARNTYNWATQHGQSWSPSTLSNHRLMVVVDNNGLVDIAIDGKDTMDMDIDGHELHAIIADHLPKDLRHLWPCWENKLTIKNNMV